MIFFLHLDIVYEAVNLSSLSGCSRASSTRSMEDLTHRLIYDLTVQMIH